ncbi:hypothetical protein H1R20_g11128, partial [Candolleomyces eurysporus]
MLVTKLEHCEMQYRFPAAVSGHGIQLNLLSLMARGQSGTVNHVRLKPHPPDSTLTLAGLLSDRSNFVGASSVCFESQRLVVYFAGNSLSYLLEGQRTGHTKLAKMFQKAFPGDSPFTPNIVVQEIDSDDDSGGDSGGGETEIDDVAVRIPPSLRRICPIKYGKRHIFQIQRSSVIHFGH